MEVASFHREAKNQPNEKLGAFMSGIENENSDPFLCRVFLIILLSFRKLLWITNC